MKCSIFLFILDKPENIKDIEVGNYNETFVFTFRHTCGWKDIWKPFHFEEFCITTKLKMLLLNKIVTMSSIISAYLTTQYNEKKYHVTFFYVSRILL